MATSLSVKDTTRAPAVVDFPLLTRDGFARLVAILEGQHPDELARLRRGLAVLASKRIIEEADGCTYLVESSVPDQFYRANTARCTCPDALQREVRCKHQWALTILVAATVAARYERLAHPDGEPIPYELTDAGALAIGACFGCHAPDANANGWCPDCQRKVNMANRAADALAAAAI